MCVHRDGNCLLVLLPRSKPFPFCCPSLIEITVVPILISVSENAADNTENAGIGIAEYASLCTNQVSCNLLAAKRYPTTFQVAQLALLDIMHLESVLLCRSAV